MSKFCNVNESKQTNTDKITKSALSIIVLQLLEIIAYKTVKHTSIYAYMLVCWAILKAMHSDCLVCDAKTSTEPFCN